MTRRIWLMNRFAFLSCLRAAAAASLVSGVVKDASGAVMRDAGVEERSAGGTVPALRKTDERGRFDWTATKLIEGRFQLRVSTG